MHRFHLALSLLLLLSASVSACEASGGSLASEDNVPSSGIAVIRASASPTPTRTATSTPMYQYRSPPPSGYQFPFKPSPFTVPACSNDPCPTPSDFLDPNDTAEVTALMNSANGGRLDLGDIYEGYTGDNTFPIYYVAPGDPTYTVTCFGGCGFDTPVSVQIPDGAYASNGADHHLTVVNLTTLRETDIFEFNEATLGGPGTANPVHGGGSLYAYSVGECVISSFTGNMNRCGNSSNGAGLPIQPMELDPREIMSGAINHVLYVAVGCAQHSAVFPAIYSDGSCGTSGPKYGQRLWLDLTDAQINALGDPPWATTMLKAMHHYGWMISDNTGGGKIGFAIMDPASFTVWGVTDPWLAFWTAASPGNNYITLPAAGITQRHVHVLNACVNAKRC